METKQGLKNLGKKKIQIIRFFRKLNEISNNNPPKVNIELTDSIYSFQDIRIEIRENAKDEVVNLVKEYENKINHTCSNCGKIENFDSICNKCQYRWSRKKTIKQSNISKTGFKIYGQFYATRFDKKYRYNFIRWNDLKNIEIDNTYDLTLIFVLNKKDFQGNDITFSYYRSQENFYHLLKNIPLHLFTKESLDNRNNILNLTCCGVCGFISKNENYSCFVCNTNGLWKDEELTERLKKRNETAKTINTKLQKEYFDRLNQKYRYPKREKEFSRCEKYQIF